MPLSSSQAIALALASATPWPSQRGLFLCHGFCELGAVPLADGLLEIRTFLLQNPNEVLIIFVEDHTSAVDTAAAFEEAGFADLAWTVEDGAELPTPREMIESGRRVLIMSENDTEGAPEWYHEGFALTQETPYSFDSPEALAAPDSADARLAGFYIQRLLPEHAGLLAEARAEVGALANLTTEDLVA